MKPISPLHKRFGQRIKELREKRGLTQEDLAFAIGVDRSYMGFIERGERNPTLDKIGKIAKALKVNIRELFDFRS
jgi:transcriptional regulator with XRE-family HTH domain